MIGSFAQKHLMSLTFGSQFVTKIIMAVTALSFAGDE